MRIIPAYAGSTITVPFRCCSGADHPRIRGEHGTWSRPMRMSVGSSPHTRGARRGSRRPSEETGIIPAYAGSTEEETKDAGTKTDHPRIRGEHSRLSRSRSFVAGSSPHTRGARPEGCDDAEGWGIIPAYAGSTMSSLPRTSRDTDHPRIRGEHRANFPVESADCGSSPHTRGAPRLRALIALFMPDHPRIRGEHVS